MSAAIQNELERLNRVNGEYQQILEPIYQYVDEQQIAKIGQSRTKALIESHQQLRQDRDAYLTAEETQILLRQRAEQKLDESMEREQALAIYVNELHKAAEAYESSCDSGFAPSGDEIDALRDALSRKPTQ